MIFRLIELQNIPWTYCCLLKTIQTGRCKKHIHQISSDTISRLSFLLQRPLVRIGREIQRLCSTLDICTKHDIKSSFRIILCPPLADSCIQAGQRALAMYIMSKGTMKQSKSARAGLNLHVGKFYSWMREFKLSTFIHE